ncbi:carboxyl-terminal processing protease [Arcticibacter tournemirensis]|uniref:S41 family peptidase n=1 Tax=Arcticibacter tournemirensis TaxID=699437 RepID=A0A5M9HG55_9SPHI|nr:S41 family peptidase [Arcticibacter tournemirensis]KAA8485533.1 S41 family peptidase [Arcticibacter tournemirensis]TQM48756.1 carboxyl-terminal processing protease [Arcticibacter tournemirensis]
MLTLNKNLRKKILIASVGIAGLSLAFSDDYFQASKNLEIFSTLYTELNMNYVDEINSSKLMQTGIDAMLESLDPYTEFVPESEMEDYRMKYVSTQYGGIGTSIQNRNGKFIIADTFEGFPAQKADIRAGDEIIKINNVSLKNRPYELVSSMLKGPKNTPLKLLINRPGEASPIEKDIVRAEITQPNISYFGMLDNNIGYIKLDKFLENSGAEVQNALMTILKNKPTGLILDLRSNGGGILQEAVKIVNLFVASNTKVVTQKGNNQEKTYTYKTYNSPIAPTLPLAVLINNRSASASEIVAGSLQDLDRAAVIGQRSFGKGLVQQTFNLPYNSLVKVTVAKYYTPSGRCIQALDYTHRTSEGSVEKVADSLISAYKTLGGRIVYDGSGIYPDIFVKPVKYSPISQTLATRYYFFDYATKYRNEKPKPNDPRHFKLSTNEYNEFINYLSDKDYNYYTRTERLLNDLQSEADKESKMAEIKAEYEALKNKVSVSKKNDFIQFKEEIQRILENEIVSRYYFQKGRMEQSFKYDEDIKAATSVITNNSSLAAILHGEGAYKSIGKPAAGFSANIAED